MEQSKTGRYIKYALGEIVLVIIGILIALSINNWNNERQLIAEEQKLLQDLRIEVASNIEALDEIILEHEKSQEAAIEYMQLFKDRPKYEAMSDSLFRSIYQRMIKNYTYDPKMGILNSMISSGQINYLSNKELKYLLASIKDQITDAFEDTMHIESWRDDIISTMYPGIFIKRDGKILGESWKQMYDNEDFRLLIHIYKILREDGLLEENDLRTSMKHILELIDGELQGI